MSAKYFKRGTREYYQVGPSNVIRIVNKASVSYVTIANIADGFIHVDALEGTEITKDEFKKQFDEAARLIVLED